MTRIIIAGLLALTLAACTRRGGNRDGMDGYGVALGLKHELEKD